MTQANRAVPSDGSGPPPSGDERRFDVLGALGRATGRETVERLLRTLDGAARCRVSALLEAPADPRMLAAEAEEIATACAAFGLDRAARLAHRLSADAPGLAPQALPDRFGALSRTMGEDIAGICAMALEGAP